MCVGVGGVGEVWCWGVRRVRWCGVGRGGWCVCVWFFFQAEDGIRDLVRSRGLGDVYKRQVFILCHNSLRFLFIKLSGRYCAIPILQANYF